MKKFILFLFVFASTVFAKEPSSTKYNWKTDLVDVEYHISNNYVKEPGLHGIVTYVPVYKSWPEWTKLLRNLVATPFYRKSNDDFDYGVTYEEYEPYRYIQNELRQLSEYLTIVRKLCGRYPTKDELVELSIGPVHSLKCSATPKINGKELHEQKHWTEALTDPELRVFSYSEKFNPPKMIQNDYSKSAEKIESVEHIYISLRLPPLISYDGGKEISGAKYYEGLDDTYLFDSHFPQITKGDGFLPMRLVLDWCNKEFIKTLFSKNPVDPDGKCFQNGEYIFPFKRYFSQKDVNPDSKKAFSFDSLNTSEFPHIYFRNYYKKKHGDLNAKIKKVKKK